MDLGILLHHAENTLYLGLTQMLKQNFGSTSTQRLVQFLMSRFFCHHNFNKFRSPVHLETKPKFWWSYPEAQTAKKMSYDTENQIIFLKKLLQRNRQHK